MTKATSAPVLVSEPSGEPPHDTDCDVFRLILSEGLGRDDSAFCQFLASMKIDSTTALDMSAFPSSKLKHLASAWIGFLMQYSTPEPKGGHADQYMANMRSNLPDGTLDNPLLLGWLQCRHETGDFPFTLLENLKDDLDRFSRYVLHCESCGQLLLITMSNWVLSEMAMQALKLCWQTTLQNMQKTGVISLLNKLA